jgi:hypothetical protein
MSITIDNYDTSSVMEDCELSCFLDSDVAASDWKENFSTIEHSSYYKPAGLHFFTEYEEHDAPDYVCECYDFAKCTYRDFRKAVIDMSRDEQSFRDLVDEMTCRHGTWKDMCESWLDECGLYQCATDGFHDVPNAELLVESTSVQGYSQGDFANVLYWTSSMWTSVDSEGKPLPQDDIKSNMRDHFNHLFYDQRIYCRLEVTTVTEPTKWERFVGWLLRRDTPPEVETEEHYFDQELKDSYEWDVDEVMSIAKDKFKLTESVLSWLEDNLPDNPTPSY